MHQLSPVHGSSLSGQAISLSSMKGKETFVLRTLGVKTSEQSLEVLTFEWLMLVFKQL